MGGSVKIYGSVLSRLRAGRVTDQHVAELRRIVASGDAAAGSMRPTAGNSFALIEGTTEFGRRVVEDIGHASEQVNATFYGLHPGVQGGPISEALIRAFCERAEAGVPVTLSLDAVGSGLVRPRPDRTAMLQRLRASGVEVRIKPFTLGRGGLDDARLAADHRKIVEIDGRVVYQGGVNPVDNWSEWLDVMIRAEGPIAAQGGALLAARWRDLGGTVSARRASILEAGLRAPTEQATHGALQLSNGNRSRREMTRFFVQSAREAKTRLWVTNPYLGDAKVVREMERAAKRGVDVRILLSPKAAHDQPQDAFTDPLRRAFAYRIREAGGQVVVLPTFSHAKVWVADDVATVGSFNLDRGSTRRNYENGIATSDPTVLAQVVSMFDRQMTTAFAPTADVVGGWRILSRIRDLFHIEY